MTKILRIFKTIPAFFLWSLLSGVMVGTSYIPFKGWALLFGYVPLWLAVLKLYRERSSLLKIFFAGWVTQFVLTLIGFNWIYYVSNEFGHLHWSLSAGALLLFAAFMHLYVPAALVISLVLIQYFRISRIWVQLVLIALCFSLLERIWPSIFEWNMAYTLLWIKAPLYQWADAVGFWGLSTWLYLFQAGLATAVSLWALNRSRAVLTAAVVLGIAGGLNLAGSERAKPWRLNNQNVKIAVAQGNIGNAEKIQSEKRYQYHSYIRGVYTDLSSQLLAQSPAELLIWPETAMPFALDPYYMSHIEQSALMATVQQWGVTLLTGGYSVSATKLDHLGYPLTRNAVFYLGPDFRYAAEPYYKTNLLVFGEYMPFGEQFPSLYKLLPFVGIYEKGSGPIVATVALKGKTLRLGPQICYDSLVPGFSRGLAENGAQILFNVTNDSWFGWWAEPFQHQLMTLARAVEVRRPLVRSTNTGISSMIQADGTILEVSPIGETWAHTFDVPYQQDPPQTFYTRYGHFDWIFWLVAAFVLIFFCRGKDEHVRS